MIEWRKYRKNDRSIKSHVPHLITNGIGTEIAFHASNPNLGYTWYKWTSDTGYDRLVDMPVVTHYAPINLPGEEEE
ncbi:hypothetical protein [Paenibacillus illinoisensis]|uniref:hypothetical protein n=1 Tax=Paenibacillus illinoisensis TaxID=59845 RepID=UPI00203C0950|nr:hypothetical protein [Paenibacillus illinoisensis]MCM3208508.1 hypothetical protein [Paenibacillus illinoisensis]